MSKRIPQKINSIEKKERLAETCYYLACQTPYESITISEICDKSYCVFSKLLYSKLSFLYVPEVAYNIAVFF